jgi:hypothetical protein
MALTKGRVYSASKERELKFKLLLKKITQRFAMLAFARQMVEKFPGKISSKVIKHKMEKSPF